MFVTWGNTYADAAVDASTELSIEMTLNMHNMYDLNTGSAYAVVPAASGYATDPFLMFYLTFLNTDSANINALPYDAFVGFIQFKSVSVATDLKWICM